MNDKQEELIWKYVDGSCTPSEESKVKNLLDHAEFKKQLTTAQALHSSLTNLNLVAAPSNLIESTLKQLSANKSMISKVPPLDYRPLKLFLAFLIAIGAGTYIISLSSMGSFTSSQLMMTYIPEWNIDFSIFTILGSFAITLLILPLLAGIDNQLANRLMIS